VADAAHVVVADLAGDALEMSQEDAHHLGSVLRLRPGEAVGATDGKGGYVACTWAGGGRLEPVSDPAFEPAPTPVLTVGFVPVKGDRPEWTVQKLTEVGVDRIVVLRAARSVVRWQGEREGAQLARLGRVARSAVMQSRRLWLPSVEAGSVEPGPSVGMAQMGAPPLDGSIDAVLVGPEGGWTEAELHGHLAGGGTTVGLGRAVLRAETAALAAGVLMVALRDGRVSPAGRR
jgi:16S rRNA (uracil1498-N3)-methyltransferase